MNVKRTLLRTALLGSTALPLLYALPALAQQGAGSYPGSFLIPGTSTSFKIGGYVKTDYTYDFGVAQSVATAGITGALVSAIPLDGNVPGTSATAGHSVHGASHISAGESRFNIETRTPSAYGEVKTFIEGDFENPSGLTPGKTFEVNSNSSGFRLRLAYGVLGPILVGQAPPLFRDPQAEPETLDFGGNIVAGPLRQPQFRYTYDLANGLSLAGSIENPDTFVIDGTSTTGATNTTFGAGQGDKIPDFVGALTYNQPWGHLSFRSVFRDLYWHAGGLTGGTTGTNVSQSQFGWGLGLSGDVHTWGKDDVLGQINGGDGIGRYSNNAGLTQDAVLNAATNKLENLQIWDASLSYLHWWADNLRSTAEASYLQVNNPKAAFTTAALTSPLGFNQLNRDLITTHVNLIWSPTPAVDFGGEYIWERRETENGQQGIINRFEASAKFKF